MRKNSEYPLAGDVRDQIVRDLVSITSKKIIAVRDLPSVYMCRCLTIEFFVGRIFRIFYIPSKTNDLLTLQ